MLMDFTQTVFDQHPLKTFIHKDGETKGFRVKIFIQWQLQRTFQHYPLEPQRYVSEHLIWN